MIIWQSEIKNSLGIDIWALYQAVRRYMGQDAEDSGFNAQKWPNLSPCDGAISEGLSSLAGCKKLAQWSTPEPWCLLHQRRKFGPIFPILCNLMFSMINLKYNKKNRNKSSLSNFGHVILEKIWDFLVKGIHSCDSFMRCQQEASLMSWDATRS